MKGTDSCCVGWKVGGALCLFRAHHFWSSHELSTCCGLNAGLFEGSSPVGGRANIHGMSPESAMKVRSTSSASSFFFFLGGKGCNNLAVSQFISFFLIIFIRIFFLGTLESGQASSGRWPGDDTGKKIYVPWKKNSRSLEKIFTAPGKEV